MKKFIEEFKAFALKGNMFDMAIGMIIGSAFTGVVNSLVNTLINPFIGAIAGQSVDFSSYSFKINGVEILYGEFITGLINFFITAFVIFMLVKVMNKIRDLGNKKEVEEEISAPKISTTDQLLMEILEELKKD